MKKLPTSIQHFPTLIRGGSLYVDKTQIIHNLITEGFGMGALTSYLLDLFMKNFGSSLIAANGNGQMVHLDGF
jgi:hypothetical protein